MLVPLGTNFLSSKWMAKRNPFAIAVPSLGAAALRPPDGGTIAPPTAGAPLFDLLGDQRAAALAAAAGAAKLNG